MTTARLVVDFSSMSFRSSGPATGDISLLLGNVVFPSPGWNDFVVVIVGAWVAALVRLTRNVSASERVHFMEGPYAVDITHLRIGAFRLRAFERPAREYALIDVPAIALLEDAAAVADAVLQECCGASDRSADVEQLELALAALRKEVPPMGS